MENEKKEEYFIQALINRFPEIERDVMDEDYVGLISLQIGCFRRFTQDAINRNNIALTQKCFSFVDEMFDLVDFKVRNLIYVSYLGKLNLTPQAKHFLPKKLRDAAAELENYYKSDSKNEKVNEFLKNLGKD